MPGSLDVSDHWFSRRWVDDDVALLGEPFVDPLLSANIWFVRGSRSDLLFDTGNGISPLCPVVAELRADTDKPLLAVVSHAHADHIGGLHEFDDRMVHRLEVEAASRGGQGPPLLADTWRRMLPGALQTEAASWPDVLVTRLPYSGFDPASFATAAATPTRVLEEGDVLELGGRSLEVLHLPGHSPGSIGLWNAERGALFSGDAIYEGGLFDELPGSQIDEYLSTMRRLISLPVEIVYPGHGDILDREQMLAIAEAYVAERARDVRGSPGPEGTWLA